MLKHGRRKIPFAFTTDEVPSDKGSCALPYFPPKAVFLLRRGLRGLDHRNDGCLRTAKPGKGVCFALRGDFKEYCPKLVPDKMYQKHVWEPCPKVSEELG